MFTLSLPVLLDGRSVVSNCYEEGRVLFIADVEWTRKDDEGSGVISVLYNAVICRNYEQNGFAYLDFVPLEMWTDSKKQPTMKKASTKYGNIVVTRPTPDNNI